MKLERNKTRFRRQLALLVVIGTCMVSPIWAQSPYPVQGLTVHSLIMAPVQSPEVIDSVPNLVPSASNKDLDTLNFMTNKDTVLVMLTYRLIYSDSVDRVHVLFGSESGTGDVLSQEIQRAGTSEAPYLVYTNGNSPLRNRTDSEHIYRFHPSDWKKVKFVGVYYKSTLGINSAMAIVDSDQ